MKLRLKNIYAFCAMALLGCKGVEPIALKSNNDVSYKESDQKGVLLGDTILYDFSEGTDGWHTWQPQNYKFYTYNRDMIIKCNEAGGEAYPSMTSTFPLSDFSKSSVIKVRMRAEGAETAPIVRLDFTDNRGIVANASAVSAYVALTDTFVEYTYDYTYGWAQNWPDNATVDKENVDQLALFVNPGVEPWTGTIIIDEIRVEESSTEEIIIDEFQGMANLWWPCKKEKVSVQKMDSTDALKVHIDDGQWDCFGKVFAPVDITDYPIIKVRARGIKDDGSTGFSNIMARFIDINDASTDLKDNDNMKDFAVGGADYDDYYSVFGEDDLYSSMGEFDPTQVNRLIIFINMNQESNYTGDVIVDQVAFVKELPREKKVVYDAQATFGPPPTPEDTWPEGDDKFVVNDISINGDDIKVSKSGSGLSIKCTNASEEWDNAEVDVKSLNMWENRYLKVTATASGNQDPLLRIDPIDNFGVVGNSRPEEKQITRNKEDVYYFAMTDNFYQRYPELKALNSKSIEKLKLYINGGLSDTFTGTIEIKNIEVIGLDEVPEDKI